MTGQLERSYFIFILSLSNKVKRRKRIYILLSFLLFTLFGEGTAQITVGINVGYSYNHLETNISNRFLTVNKNGGGIGFGVVANYVYNKKMNLQVEFTFINKAHSFYRTGAYSGIEANYNNHYFQLPLTLQYNLLQKNKYKIFLDIGGFVSYWESAYINGKIPNIFNSYDSISNYGQITHYLRLTNYAEKYQFNEEKDNRWEFGIHSGLTCAYIINKRLQLHLSGKFFQSITDIQKKYMTNQNSQYNQTIFVSIGGMVSLKKKRDISKTNSTR